MMDRNQHTFTEEAKELLTDLEEALLAIEHDPQNMDLVGRIFRAMHTIKGSSAMVGYDAIASFTHEIETAFDLVREGIVKVSPELITLTLESRDHIAGFVNLVADGGTADEAFISKGTTILRRLQTLVPKVSESGVSSKSSAEIKPEVSAGDQKPILYRIHFKPPENIFLRGMDPLNLIEELAAMGEMEQIDHIDKVTANERQDGDLCHSIYDILLSTAKPAEEIRDVFIFVEEDSELRIEKLYDETPLGRDKWQPLLEAMRASKDTPTSSLRALINETQVHQERVKTDAAANPAVSHHPDQKAIQSIKVPSERLDKLVNLVGELVTVQARLTQSATNLSDPGLTQIAEEVESLVSELRDNAMSIRMIPIGTTFARFQRLVRDLSLELGKEIQLVTEGENTELDKTVIERLGDPLVHMIRNSIDHGIETPDKREAAGKPRMGTIRLSAAHSGTNVNVSISDDGRGFDLEAIRLQGVMRGSIEPDAHPTEQELLALILAPGFSTAEKVTSVSGRGVGMDVVRRSIEELGGRIEVSNKQGQGSTITLKLPLTLAIIEGLLVKVSSDLFVLPLASIKECVELPPPNARRGNGGQLINVRGEIIPYVRMRDYFRMTGELPSIEYVVISEIEGKRCGFAVDAILGDQQVVIKSLGRTYKDVKGISGATVLGDGTVALIIDIPPIIAAAEREREQLVRFDTLTTNEIKNNN
jgi:two-component system chemotaxis sensor kinase CheA